MTLKGEPGLLGQGAGSGLGNSEVNDLGSRPVSMQGYETE